MKKIKKKRRTEKIDEEEYDFCLWLRNKILDNPGITKKDIKQEILKSKKHCFIYFRKHVNYKSLINDFFNNRLSAKPKVNYDWKFWIPRKLKDYLDYLNNWIELWYTDKSKLPQRPMGLVLTGLSRTGKTSLILLISSCSYWKNLWNSDNYELLAAINVMDDIEVVFDSAKDFGLYKGWFGGQDCITTSDKYRPKIDIDNGKPLIWLNNSKLEEFCPHKGSRDYIEKNCCVVELGNEDLISPKNRSTIGGFCEWVEFDPKSTWYYQNIVCNENTEEIIDEIDEFIEEQDNPFKGKEPESEIIDLTQDDDEPKSQSIATSSFVPNGGIDLTSGLDGSTNRISQMKYYDKIIDEISDRLGRITSEIEYINDESERLTIRINKLDIAYRNSYNKKNWNVRNKSLKELIEYRNNIIFMIKDHREQRNELDNYLMNLVENQNYLLNDLHKIIELKSKIYK